MSRSAILRSLSLKGLELAPSQVFGGVRLVPLLRGEVRGDLRLALRRYDEDLCAVSLGGRPGSARATVYTSYVPHALVVSWADGEKPAASYGGRLFKSDGRRLDFGSVSVRLATRMVRREAPRQLRLLPLHLAMEGFLSLHFGGPDVAWREYSRHALSRGLDPRSERVVPGQAVPGLEDALRVFEIHPRQCGALVFVADALASAFVVSHPEDYRALHHSLVEDCYGELVGQYGLIYRSVGSIEAPLAEGPFESISELREALARMRREQADCQRLMADELFARPLDSSSVYELGDFTLQRFMTDLDPDHPNHIGECITRADGSVEYLKSYRLSAGKARRAYLLKKLAESGWDLDRAATAFATDRHELMLRLEKAGFGYLLREDVLALARKRRGP
jgi:hypothetical protein